jgi:hypothetical protein
LSGWPGSGFSGTLPGSIGVMVMAMMTNERKIWEAALLLVRRHGAEAALVAQREAQRLRRNDDELTCVVWCWIPFDRGIAAPGAGQGRTHPLTVPS